MRAGPLAAGAAGCALVVDWPIASRRVWCGVPHRGCCCLPVFEPSGSVLGSGRGPAGVVHLADSVEFPYGSETEMRQALHVTLLLSRSPSTAVHRSTRCPSRSRSTYTLAPRAQVQCVCVTSASQLLEEAASFVRPHDPGVRVLSKGGSVHNTTASGAHPSVMGQTSTRSSGMPA